MFKKYSQMKLQMKREALDKINRRANEKNVMDSFDAAKVARTRVLTQFWHSEGKK